MSCVNPGRYVGVLSLYSNGTMHLEVHCFARNMDAEVYEDAIRGHRATRQVVRAETEDKCKEELHLAARNHLIYTLASSLRFPWAVNELQASLQSLRDKPSTASPVVIKPERKRKTKKKARR